MVPWGTPARIGVKFEISEPTFVEKNLFSRYNLKNKYQSGGRIVFSLYRRPGC